MIPYARQSISEQDIEAVTKVLRSDFITQGEIGAQFEQAIADYCSVKYAVSVSSGTAALHLSCLALGVGTGDIVWTVPNTFLASANCALYCNAEINFVDIDPISYNISIKALKKKLQWAAKEGCLPKVIIPVHFSGQSCEMKVINNLSVQYGFAIIEDASHALGGEYCGKKVGNCLYSDLAVFSFHPAKMITTGEGGMVVTNNKKLAEKIERLRTHGVTKNSEKMTKSPHGDWYYQQIELGFNYRITDIQAALGLSQLQRLDEFVSKRQELAERYHQQLQLLPLKLPVQSPDTRSSWHLYVIRLKLSELEIDRKSVFDQLRQAGIGVHVHYIPVHRQPYYQQLGFNLGDFPESESYYEEALTLPLFVELSYEQVNYIVKEITRILLH